MGWERIYSALQDKVYFCFDFALEKLIGLPTV